MHAFGVRQKAKVGRQLRQLQHLAQAQPHALRRGGQIERAIGGIKGAVGRNDRMHVAARLRNFADAKVALALDAEQAEQTGEQRSFNMLADSALLALDVRGQHPHRDPHSSGQVANRCADPGRTEFGGASQAHEARIALCNLVKAGPVTRGTRAAEAGD